MFQLFISQLHSSSLQLHYSLQVDFYCVCVPGKLSFLLYLAFLSAIR